MVDNMRDVAVMQPTRGNELAFRVVVKQSEGNLDLISIENRRSRYY